MTKFSSFLFFSITKISFYISFINLLTLFMNSQKMMILLKKYKLAKNISFIRIYKQTKLLSLFIIMIIITLHIQIFNYKFNSHFQLHILLSSLQIIYNINLILFPQIMIEFDFNITYTLT